MGCCALESGDAILAIPVRKLISLRGSASRSLRKLLVVGACSALAARKGHNDALRRWASGMLERKTVKYKFKLCFGVQNWL